jgi:very-short-patch-repair endonuclease
VPYLGIINIQKYIAKTQEGKVVTHIEGYAKGMRCRPTSAEHLLVDALRAVRHDCGWKICSQVVLGPYIADVLIPNLKVVVEVDGKSHIGREAYDLHRDAFLRSRGFRVLHIKNEDVWMDLCGALKNIETFAGHGVQRLKTLRKFGPLLGVQN